ncbi:hypothetical protein [Ottowia thiooxydans]|uniref:Uncharacterized protein n=1 Tax=Ottowia thiooxydans TaxID=219182 RepID=A0ABV2QC97_9BURK
MLVGFGLFDVTNPSVFTAYIMKRSANEAGGFHSQNGVIERMGLGVRLVSSGGEVNIVLKAGNEAQNIMRSAMQNFSTNFGSLASNLILNKKVRFLD